MVIKELIDNRITAKDQFSKNIEQYLLKGLEKGNAIYFYAIDPTKRKSNVDSLSWIRDITHEEYDMISLTWIDGSKEYCQSRILNDKVIQLDLTDRDVKKVFDDKFKIGTTWANEDIACKLVKMNSLFVKELGYDFYNFIVAKDNNVIMDALLYGGEVSSIYISKELVDDVEKE